MRPWAGVGVLALASSGVLAPLPQNIAATTSAAYASREPVVATGQGGADLGTAGILPRQSQAATGTATGASKPVHRRLVVLGDSVANRPECGCQSFASRYAKLVRDRATVRVDNLAGDGQTTTSVLHVLAHPHARQLVAKADTVVFVAGANDYRQAFAEVGDGRSDVTAYRVVAQRVQANLVTAIRKVTRLNPLARVITFGYWNAFKDGAVAQAAYTPQQRVRPRPRPPCRRTTRSAARRRPRRAATSPAGRPSPQRAGSPRCSPPTATTRARSATTCWHTRWRRRWPARFAS